MQRTFPPRTRADFDVAVICALPFEADAVDVFFDCRWDDECDRYGKAPGDQNSYRTGLIGKHNTVLTCMPGIGKGFAAGVAASLRSSFQNIRLALIIGVCGGVPNGNSKGIFLGDVIISDEIITYDHGRRYTAGLIRKEGITESTSSTEVRAFVQKIQSQHGYKKTVEKARQSFANIQQIQQFCRPEKGKDQLFPSSYHHKHRLPSDCPHCENNEHCKSAQVSTCIELGCEMSFIDRSRTGPSRIDIHFGRIGSGDTVMKSAQERDRIASEDNLIAFEMEGAGVCTNLPCIVIKGVCDYADSHKDKKWQHYAAGTAAATMKAVLDQWSAIDRPREAIDKSREATVCQQELLLEASHGAEMTPEIQSQQALLQEERSSTDARDRIDPTNKALSDILPVVESIFRGTLASLKKKRIRKYLPRDFDIKQSIKTSRSIYLDGVEALATEALDSENAQVKVAEPVCLEFVLAIKQQLEEIADHIKCFPVPTQKGKESKIAPNDLKDSVKDLASLVQNFFSSVPRKEQPRYVGSSESKMDAQESHKFQHFQMIQQAACSLYEALGTACNAHPTHSVHLDLRPNIEGLPSQVRFNVAFIQGTTPTAETFWIRIESIIKEASDASLDSVPEVTLVPSSSSKKRPMSTQTRSISLESRKRVHFEPSVGFSAPIFLEQPLDRVPKLYLSRNLCTLVERHLQRDACNGCIGLLRDNEVCKHLAYVGHRTKNNSSMSLSQLMSLSGSDLTQNMSQYQRVKLARYLATAVLYYHTTPWLKDGWRSKDVRFLGDPESLLRNASLSLPYMITSIHASAPSTALQTQSSEDYNIIRNKVLFGLGVMFLELAYQSPIENLQKPIDLERGVSPEFTEYFRARRLADQSFDRLGLNFTKMVRKCLFCDFGHDNDFKSLALQEAFYRDIIGGLGDLEKYFEKLELGD